MKYLVSVLTMVLLSQTAFSAEETVDETPKSYKLAPVMDQLIFAESKDLYKYTLKVKLECNEEVAGKVQYEEADAVGGKFGAKTLNIGVIVRNVRPACVNKKGRSAIVEFDLKIRNFVAVKVLSND